MKKPNTITQEILNQFSDACKIVMHELKTNLIDFDCSFYTNGHEGLDVNITHVYRDWDSNHEKKDFEEITFKALKRYTDFNSDYDKKPKLYFKDNEVQIRLYNVGKIDVTVNLKFRFLI